MTGKRIVYDDAAIARLLDRSDMGGGEEDEGEQDDSLMKSFKVATFEEVEEASATEERGGACVGKHDALCE